MKSKLNLMAALVGLAMLALPLTAAAKDHGRFHNSQARIFTPARNVAPVVVTRHEFRHGATWMPAPAAVARHNWRGNHRGWNDGDADDYQNYGNSGYYPAPVYAAPVYAAPVYSSYGGGLGRGQGCGQAQRVMRTFARDRATGHPAAAYDVLRQNQWAMHSGCAAEVPAAGRGLGRLGRRGRMGGLGGLGGYGGAPAYGNGVGYNGGYGQPYGGGSMLTPLLQYIR